MKETFCTQGVETNDSSRMVFSLFSTPWKRAAAAKCVRTYRNSDLTVSSSLREKAAPILAIETGASVAGSALLRCGESGGQVDYHEADNGHQQRARTGD
jgi:hypothetical protein